MDLLKKIPFKKYWWALALILVLIAVATTFVLVRGVSDPSTSNETADNKTATSSAQSGSSGAGDPNSLDPIEKGRALANGKGSGEGGKKLNGAPMKTSEISYIVPY